MKRKVKLVDKINNKTISTTVEIPAKDHLKSQQINKASIQQDKTKIIPRKRKYKKIDEDK